MRHWTQFVIAVVAAASVAACSGRNGTNGATGTSGRSSLSSAEQSFLKDQIKDSQKEIRLGRLAQSNASSPDVKELGTMMVRDHTQQEQQLREFAERNGVDLRDIRNDSPNDNVTGTSGKADNNYPDDNGLAKKTGPDFDKDYVDQMVKDHKDAVDAFTKRSEDKDNLELAQFASKALPKLEEHLQHAQQLQQQLENANNSANNTTAAEKTSKAAHNAKNKVKKH